MELSLHQFRRLVRVQVGDRVWVFSVQNSNPLRVQLFGLLVLSQAVACQAAQALEVKTSSHTLFRLRGTRRNQDIITRMGDFYHRVVFRYQPRPDFQHAAAATILDLRQEL
ncbi:hypothetical protein SS50377_24174 [Spironucleus salmonicida]|uniref:Uncharacterized protein n=1 Tax=Spironucleus salmonicida TaxID=348837 RepID=V6LI65_9EUKA|nr:hypothetical protein SS50377_24146 [Spironucleus salmonicida]KAH0574215.1 hypothetical protein SS50377_24162 [Spironucleus salmonicida]KAH0574217.1 hypothetical protein SS50377_24164 [Spironucleus salmonicida]KAH0574226.1 hypothetical protein SS50377_24174 [Spironucleus salmonicida]|eukprot:EST44265.1 Hypothetical protein SS50377_15928 [Spironucleus salmonicida]